MSGCSDDNCINLLLMGQTGVGKSTFINAFANYLNYASFNEAANNTIYNLIYSKFIFMSNEVIIGTKDDNEDTSNASSNTQKCRSYIFPYKNTKIRIIDTPGMGDTRGIEKDTYNISNILSYINQFDKINGICILLKPNEARSTVYLEYCINEILTSLHINAVNNIVFLFPNSKQTYYQLGDIKIPLEKYLKDLKDKKKIDIQLEKKRMYFVDNESFRILAVLKNNISFENKEEIITDSNNSWHKSSEESIRLIEYIKSIKPHITKETITLNNVRNIIWKASQPMAEISYMIESQIELLKRKENEIESVDSTIQDLNSRLIIPYIDLQAITLDHPRTVCTSEKCITIESNVPRYLRHCHKKCSIENVTVNTKAHPNLQFCYAIDTKTKKCKHCSCTWEHHMHVTIDYIQVQKNKIDNEVNRQINVQTNNKDKIKTFIDSIKCKINNLKNEQLKLIDATVKFAVFLNKNSIKSYNNSSLDYIELCIDKERKLSEHIKNGNILKELLEYKRQIIEQISILNNSTNITTINITPESITTLMDDLCKLPICGIYLNNAIDKINESNKKYINHSEITIESKKSLPIKNTLWYKIFGN